MAFLEKADVNLKHRNVTPWGMLLSSKMAVQTASIWDAPANANMPASMSISRAVITHKMGIPNSSALRYRHNDCRSSPGAAVTTINPNMRESGMHPHAKPRMTTLIAERRSIGSMQQKTVVDENSVKRVTEGILTHMRCLFIVAEFA